MIISIASGAAAAFGTAAAAAVVLSGVIVAAGAFAHRATGRGGTPRADRAAGQPVIHEPSRHELAAR